MVFKLRPAPPYPTPTQQDEHSGPVQPRKNTALPLPPVGGLFSTRSRINISVWSPSIFCGGLLLVSVTEKWGLLSSAQFSLTGLTLDVVPLGVHSSDCPHLCWPGSGSKPEEASQEDVMLLPPSLLSAQFLWQERHWERSVPLSPILRLEWWLRDFA